MNKPVRHWPWAQRLYDRLTGQKHKRELYALKTDLRLTVMAVRKVINGTEMEANIDPMLARIYERLCP